MILLNVLEGNIILSPKVSLSGTIGIAKAQITGDIIYNGRLHPTEYQGSYEIIPSQETQVLSTKDNIMTDNLVIKPIPDNYGLITWNGAYLMVS